MDQQQYEAALGELQRLQELARHEPSHPDVAEEYMATLRREIKAYEEGVRSKGRPPS
jgi:type VI protein secretion system component VasF